MAREEVGKLVKTLGLVPHPTENGYFSGRLLYSAPQTTVQDKNNLALCDLVQFLYEEGDYSPWHRMRGSDVTWIHQAGGAIQILMFNPETNTLTEAELEPLKMITVPGDTWYSARPAKGSAYSLSAILLSPGFFSENCEFLSRETYAAEIEKHIPGHLASITSQLFGTTGLNGIQK